MPNSLMSEIDNHGVAVSDHVFVHKTGISREEGASLEAVIGRPSPSGVIEVVEVGSSVIVGGSQVAVGLLRELANYTRATVANDNRQHRRHHIIHVIPATLYHDGKYEHGVLIDVSLGGFGMLAHGGIEPGRPVIAALRLPDDATCTDVLTADARISNLTRLGDGIFRIGCEFVGLADGSRAALQRYLGGKAAGSSADHGVRADQNYIVALHWCDQPSQCQKSFRHCLSERMLDGNGAPVSMEAEVFAEILAAEHPINPFCVPDLQVMFATLRLDVNTRAMLDHFLGALVAGLEPQCLPSPGSPFIFNDKNAL